jgi:hypothetical protein
MRPNRAKRPKKTDSHLKGKGEDNSTPAKQGHPEQQHGCSSGSPPAPAPVQQGTVADDLEDEDAFLDSSAQRIQAYERELKAALEQCSPPEREYFEGCGGFADKSDFNRLLFHRHCCISTWPHGDEIVPWLEVIASKMMYRDTSGKPGYFASWQGWDDTAALIACSEWSKADCFVKCAIRVSAKNPGYCRQCRFCPFCLWMEFLEPYVTALGLGTGAFQKTNFVFASISWTDSSVVTRRADYRDLRDEDFDLSNPESGLLRSKYSPTPFTAEDGNQIEEVRALCALQGRAITHLYRKGKRRKGGKLITGYRWKNELAVTLDSVNRFLPNQHSILTTDDPGQHLADELYDFIRPQLETLKREGIVRRCIQPDILLLRINSEDDLIRCLKYVDKAIDLIGAWQEAVNRPDALRRDGRIKSAFSEMMIASVLRLFGEVDELLTKPASMAAGTLRFGKGFIGQESPRHQKLREGRADKARKRRDKIIAEIIEQWPDPEDRKEQIRRRLRRRKPKISPLDE